MPDLVSNNAARLANLPIGSIVLDLEGEELKCELLELLVYFRWARSFRGRLAVRNVLNENAQAFGVFGK